MHCERALWVHPYQACVEPFRVAGVAGWRGSKGQSETGSGVKQIGLKACAACTMALVLLPQLKMTAYEAALAVVTLACVLQ